MCGWKSPSVESGEAALVAHCPREVYNPDLVPYVQRNLSIFVHRNNFICTTAVHTIWGFYMVGGFYIEALLIEIQ